MQSHRKISIVADSQPFIKQMLTRQGASPTACLAPYRAAMGQPKFRWPLIMCSNSHEIIQLTVIFIRLKLCNGFECKITEHVIVKWLPFDAIVRPHIHVAVKDVPHRWTEGCMWSYVDSIDVSYEVAQTWFSAHLTGHYWRCHIILKIIICVYSTAASQFLRGWLFK